MRGTIAAVTADNTFAIEGYDLTLELAGADFLIPFGMRSAIGSEVVCRPPFDPWMEKLPDPSVGNLDVMCQFSGFSGSEALHSHFTAEGVATKPLFVLQRQALQQSLPNKQEEL